MAYPCFGPEARLARISNSGSDAGPALGFRAILLITIYRNSLYVKNHESLFAYADAGDDDRLFRRLYLLSFAGSRPIIRVEVPCQDEHPKNRAAFGIGRSGDTSPRLGCCEVAEGCCGGNLLKMRKLLAKWVVRGYCGSNPLLPLGEPVESTKREAGTSIPARSRACSLRYTVRKGSPLRSDRCAACCARP